jgi:hypothetical protein
MPKIQTIPTCFQNRLTVILEVRGSRRLKLDLDPEIALASFCYRLKTMPSVGAHPDEKLAVSPGKQVHWDQTKSR